MELVKTAANIDKQDPPGMNTDFTVPSIFTGPTSPDVLGSNSLNAQEVPVDTSHVPRLRMVSFVETFILWRPWNVCPRCVKAIEDDVTILPQMEGDITCPHVQKSAYKAIKDKCLHGEGIIERETFSTLKDGTQIVLFSWLETDKEYLEKLKKAEAEKEETRVWPPNPDRVFAELVESPKK